jgi:hypothetical protein
MTGLGVGGVGDDPVLERGAGGGEAAAGADGLAQLGLQAGAGPAGGLDEGVAHAVPRRRHALRGEEPAEGGDAGPRVRRAVRVRVGVESGQQDVRAQRAAAGAVEAADGGLGGEPGAVAVEAHEQPAEARGVGDAGGEEVARREEGAAGLGEDEGGHVCGGGGDEAAAVDEDDGVLVAARVEAVREEEGVAGAEGGVGADGGDERRGRVLEEDDVLVVVRAGKDIADALDFVEDEGAAESLADALPSKSVRRGWLCV